MNPVVHFEIPYDDHQKAQEFYSIFNWELNHMPEMNYTSAQTAPTNDHPGAINGGLMPRTSEVKGPVIAVQVDSVDNFIEKVLEKGGKLVMPKTKIPNMGYYAYVTDLEDNVLGLWEPLHT